MSKIPEFLIKTRSVVLIWFSFYFGGAQHDIAQYPLKQWKGKFRKQVVIFVTEQFYFDGLDIFWEQEFIITWRLCLGAAPRSLWRESVHRFSGWPTTDWLCSPGWVTGLYGRGLIHKKMLEKNKGFVIYLEPTTSLKGISVKIDGLVIELSLFKVPLHNFVIFIYSPNKNISLDQLLNPLLCAPERP